MPNEVVEYVAHNINTNIRELEGAMISLLAQSSMNRKEIDLDLAKQMMKNFVKILPKKFQSTLYKNWFAIILPSQLSM